MKTKPHTKKEVIEYALHLKSSKKGNSYIKNMVISKYPLLRHGKDNTASGLGMLKSAVTDPKNPSRLNASTKAILESIVFAD
jgi:hypothetical protein